MKLELTDKFIKIVENRCKKFLPKDSWFEIQKVNLDLIDGAFWTFYLGWGKDDKYHNEELFLEDEYYSVDFICGMIYQLIEVKEDDN